MVTATTVLAHWHGHHGWWPALWFVVWLAVVGLVLFFFARRGRGGGGRPGAEAILAERYARGEISAGEYRERLGNLR
jgi:putative membrane protein